MAEFCLDCYNKRHGTHLTEKDVKLDLDLCEDCGEVKPAIVVFRRRGLRRLTGVFSDLSGALEDLARQYRYGGTRERSGKSEAGRHGTAPRHSAVKQTLDFSEKFR